MPGALYNTVQQLFLLRSGALQPDVSSDLVTRATLRMLFYCNLWQAVWLVALWFLDLIPFFGFSSSVAEFWTNTVFSITCSFAGKHGAIGPDASQCVSQWATSPNIWAFGFVLAYSVSYIGSAQLNRESSTFNLLVAVITSSATAAFFLIPGTNPNATGTPAWSVVTSMAISLVSMVLWKRWESQTPPEEQFDAARAAPGADKGGFSALLSEDDDGAGYALGSGWDDR